MGTHWIVTLWDPLDDIAFERIRHDVIAMTHAFDETFSRFKPTSVVRTLTKQLGVVSVPRDLVAMLRLYERLNVLSNGACNPLVGFTLSDLGYDEQYSLRPKEQIRSVPQFREAVRIVDDEHLDMRQSTLIDLGALGKGYFVDKLSEYLKRIGIRRFLVDGSGDVFYRTDGEPIRVGLEHPGDTSKVIGVVTMQTGAMCSSAGSRRKWGSYHHTIDPRTITSPTDIIATWVMADTASLADGLATCVFLTDPDIYAKEFRYDYCVLNSAYRVKRSKGFSAELF